MCYAKRKAFMKTTEELKKLNIELPQSEEITGYKGIYNRWVKRVLDFVFSLLAVLLLSFYYAGCCFRQRFSRVLQSRKMRLYG